MIEKQKDLFEIEHESVDNSVNNEKDKNENDRKVLDELFELTFQYRKTKSYFELMKFITSFRHYSFFNAMLIHIQMSGAVYVAPPERWWNEYKRTIKPGARLLVILRPKGPVMFVFDVSETEGKPLPDEIENPYGIRSGKLNGEYKKVCENCARDGVKVHYAKLGSIEAGSISNASFSREFLSFDKEKVEVRYEIELNLNASDETNFAIMAHELAHLYCGHLGTSNPKWWPDRIGLKHDICEFEAESVSYMVCKRLGLDTPSEKYLSNFVANNEQVPPISFDCVMKAGSLIYEMSTKKMKLRKN